jgi:hypothetical protein
MPKGMAVSEVCVSVATGIKGIAEYAGLKAKNLAGKNEVENLTAAFVEDLVAD